MNLYDFTVKEQVEETKDEVAAALKEWLKGFSSFTGAKDI